MTHDKYKDSILNDIKVALAKYLEVKKGMPTIALVDLITDLTILKNSKKVSGYPEIKESLEIITNDLVSTLNRTR